MDTISNALTIIKNASAVKKESCSFPASRVLEAISKILKKENFIKDFKREKRDGKPVIKVILNYIANNQPAITEIRRISHLGRRVYIKHKDIRVPKYGITILSTPKGIMLTRDAKKSGVGGEVICQLR